MQSQTKRYGKPQYQTQEIQNSQFVNSVVPSESTISLNAPYGIENFDALLGTEEYADQMLSNLKKQDIYQTAAVDYQEVYNNDGQYINLQRRRLMPDLTVSQSQIMEQANRLNQSNIQTRDQRRFKTGNHITQSTAIQNITQRAGETGQLLPTITPFDGVQQDPQGYDGIVNTSFAPKVPLNENFVRVNNYQDKSNVRPQKEQFQFITTPTSSQNGKTAQKEQNFDTSGQVADLLTLFPDYKVKLTPAMQANLISILNVLVENPAAFSEVRKSTEYQMLPLMYKFNLYRAKVILNSK